MGRGEFGGGATATGAGSGDGVGVGTGVGSKALAGIGLSGHSPGSVPLPVLLHGAGTVDKQVSVLYK